MSASWQPGTKNDQADYPIPVTLRHSVGEE